MKRLILALLVAVIAGMTFTTVGAHETETPELTVQRISSGHSKHFSTAESVVTTETGVTVTTFIINTFRPPLSFDILSGDLVLGHIPEDEIAGSWGNIYTITVMQTPFGMTFVDIDYKPQIWWWGVSRGFAPMPGDPRLFQSVGPWSFSAYLHGCHSFLKPGNNEALVCIQPGWEPLLTVD